MGERWRQPARRGAVRSALRRGIGANAGAARHHRADTCGCPNRSPEYLRRFDPPAPLLAQTIGMRRWVTPNIWFAPIAIPANSSARTYLVYARRNTTMAKHTHVGHEFTSVLYGSFSDDTGTYGPGDFAETDNSIVHAPAITGESDCLSLISTDAPMRLVGLTARVIQTMTGTLY